MKIEQEMTNKYSYDNWDKFKCNENTEFLILEKKLDPFSINKGYNYASNMNMDINELPDINLDLSKISEYYKNLNNNSTDDLIKEISSYNNYFKSMTKDINFNKVETLKEKSIIYYLFYILSRAFFYTIMSNNFMFTKEYTKEYSEFFTNYKKILEASKLYINDDISNNKDMIIEVKEKEFEKINNSIYDAFKCLKNYPNEFKDAIISCQNFLIVILFSSEFKENKFFGVPSRSLDKESSK